jgi:hypothetical protein
MVLALSTLRAQVGPGPSDDVLEALLAAALEAIDGRYGEWVRLGRRAYELGAVTDGGDAVDAADVELWPGGRYVRRLSDDEPTDWSGWVDVTYTPLSEAAERDRIAMALVKLDVSHTPGLTGITVGPWSEQYAQSDGTGYIKQREAILGSLRPLTVGTW